ncbi:hypothetical protein D9757_013733 [Collybiopsis confluens]|uniref:RING-type domain-containing protein n=1 Tax=Collybiopsis confluens TaxID=2823264 RepID=A0A8H5CZQ1_9AGAR|nr:hypothetical protein D9757_013733 [Collybiopsis confluens]
MAPALILYFFSPQIMDDPPESGLGGAPGAGAGRLGSIPARQRGPLPSILFIMLMLLLFTSHNGEEFLARHQYQEALQRMVWQSENYTAWLGGGISNFSLPDRNSTALALLKPVLTHLLPSNGTVNPAYKSYYTNITGFIPSISFAFNAHVHANETTVQSDTHSESESQTQTQPELQSGIQTLTQNMTKVLETLGSWNWSAPDKVAFSVVEKIALGSSAAAAGTTGNASNPNFPRLNGNGSNEDIALIHGRIEFSDPHVGEDLRLEFEGVHFIKNGTIFGFAEPPGPLTNNHWCSRAVDIRLLPSIVPEDMKNVTALLIEPELESRIQKLRDLIDAGIIEDINEDESPKTACPFIVFAQINSVDVSAEEMDEYEEEIQRPTGIRTRLPSRLSMRSVLVSKECGILYEVSNMEGLRSRTFFRKVTTYAGTAAITYLLLLVLFTRQMGRSSTPSGISRLSRYTFLVQSTIDSVSFAGHVTFAVLAEGRPSLSLIAPSFLACVVFLYQASPEDAPSPAPPPPPPPPPPAPSSVPVPAAPSTTLSSPAISTSAPSGVSATDIVPATTTTTANANTINAQNNVQSQLSNTDEVQPPETTTTPQPGVPPPPPLNQNQNMSFWTFFWQQIRSDPQARLIILSPTLTLLFVAVTYSSVWLPQIWRSARRGRSSGLSVEYLAMVLICQEYFGPAFFLPRRFSTVNTYNYHPPLPLPDEESPEKSLGDCAICMDAIFIDPSYVLAQHRFGTGTGDSINKDGWDSKASGADTTPSSTHYPPGRRKSISSSRAGGGGGGGRGPSTFFDAVQRGVGSAVTRKNYSLAPCHHLFHTECLERLCTYVLG